MSRVIEKVGPGREQPPSPEAAPSLYSAEFPESTPPEAEAPAATAAEAEAAVHPAAPADALAVAPDGGAYFVWMKGLWNHASTLITVLGLLAYLLGRVMVDAFYGQLHTTPEAVGIGYASILEPAAIVMAVSAFVWFGVVTTINALPITPRLKRILSNGILGVLVAASGSVALAGNLLPVDASDMVTTLLLTGAIPSVRTLLDRIRGIKTSNRSESPSRPNSHTYAQVRPLVTSVLAVIFLGGLFYGAHLFGMREGRDAAEGHPVNAEYFWLDIPSISATTVSVRPITPSTAFNQLTARACWLQIGSSASEVLLYNPAEKLTLMISADQLVIASADPSCMEQPAAKANR